MAKVAEVAQTVRSESAPNGTSYPLPRPSQTRLNPCPNPLYSLRNGYIIILILDRDAFMTQVYHIDLRPLTGYSTTSCISETTCQKVSED